MSLSRKTLSVIKQNISFSLGIKALALLLIVPGWLTLWMAVFADMGATLMVTLNSLRLLRVKDG
jgi:Cd2+/Zn2+-exporting ATPase